MDTLVNKSHKEVPPNGKMYSIFKYRSGLEAMIRSLMKDKLYKEAAEFIYSAVKLKLPINHKMTAEIAKIIENGEDF